MRRLGMDKHRQHTSLEGLDRSCLPKHIKHGIPKAMTVDLEATFWGDNLEQGACKDKALAQAIGLPTSAQQQVLASSQNQEVKQCVLNNNIVVEQVNARQAFEAIKANKEPPHMPLPYQCQRQAPEDINVYTDGSWIHPLRQFLGIGGAGVWWPGRNPAVCHRLSQAEEDLAYHR